MLRLLFVTALLGLAAAASVPEAPLYPDRLNLLKLRDGEGREEPITRRTQWERRRRHILLNMQKVMGPLPDERCPLDVRVEREERLDGYTRRKLTYQSAPGERVPAYLLLPEGKGKRPAVLALHQTVAIGKEEPVGLGGSPNLQYGLELVRRGYVVLAPDYPTLGEHRTDVYAHGWQSASMKAIWDNIRGVDLLQSLPEVADGRIGALGHSLGGHNTLFTAAFEPRLKAVISNCGFTAFGKYYGGNLTGWTGERYMPRIRTLFPTPARMPFDFHEVVAAIAPRAVLASAPVRDGNFEVSGVRDVIAAAAPVYRLLGRPDALKAAYPDCAHDWPADERRAAHAWLDAALAADRPAR
jgi:dienelactone hydrolase